MDDRGATDRGASRSVVLWEHGSVSCACLHLAPDLIEIGLLVNGQFTERKQFTDAESASQYAIAKMHMHSAH